MATQTVEFRAATGLTITAKLFAAGSDTEVASVSATEATNRKGTYSAAFTDVAAGEYVLIALSSEIPVASWWVTLTLAIATFQTYDRVNVDLSDLTEAVEALPTVEEIQASDRLVLVSTTIATLASQTSFTLTAGSADNDAYKNCFAIITDASTALQKSVRKVTSYVGSSRTVTLESPPDFAIAASDSIAIVARVGGANVTLTALTLVQANQADSGEIRVKVGETCAYTLSILAPDKSLADLSDATLKITINNDAGETVATVEAADIAGSGAIANPITFDLPSAATAAPTNAWIASIADTADGNRVLWDGPWIVERTARET